MGILNSVVSISYYGIVRGGKYTQYAMAKAFLTENNNSDSKLLIRTSYRENCLPMI